MKTTRNLFIFIVVMLTHGVLFALPQTPLNMDNDYSDWKGGDGGSATCFTDESGVDEGKLNRADITEYCLHIDSNESGGLYLLMAIDDTAPKNSADIRIVIDIDGDQIPDYSINNTLNKNGSSIVGVSIGECQDSECALNDLVLICTNDGDTVCTGTTEGFNQNWPSQFTSSQCDGTNCRTLDGFIEMFVPWTWLGGTPPSTYLFGFYLSSHSGGTEDISSDTTGQGIACNDSGCYVSEPTAVTLQSFFVASENGVALWPIILMLLLSSGYLVSRYFKS